MNDDVILLAQLDILENKIESGEWERINQYEELGRC